MRVDELILILEPGLTSLGHVAAPGDEYHEPALVLVHQFVRPVRLSWVPLIGRASSLVLIARQPADLDAKPIALAELWCRVARIASHRFPLRLGPSLPTTLLVITPEPIEPGEDANLGQSLETPSRDRIVRLGLFRINLGQEAVSFALRRATGAVLHEPDLVADALSAHLKRYLPPLNPADFS